MSKVKRPIDEAREFAAAEGADTNDQPEAAHQPTPSEDNAPATTEMKNAQSSDAASPEKKRQEYVARKEQTVLTDDNNEGVVYSSEQGLRNTAVRLRVEATGKAWIELAEKHKEEAELMHTEESEAIATKMDAMHEFHRDFMVPPEGPNSAENIAETLKLF